jgi:ABC-type glycerol-3-phosphate transport system substrate-binding protein
MTSRKFFVMLTCLLLSLTFVLSACGSGEKSGGTSSTTGGGTTIGHGGFDSEKNRYYVNMPSVSFEEKEFNVLVLDNTKETTYYSEEVGVDKYETTDDALETAVRNRNNKVFEDYGVTINAVYSSNVTTDLDNDVKADTGAYDMAMPFFTGCVTLAQSGDLYDLRSEEISKYIDLTMPWWDQNATESLSVDNKVYFTTGDISIMQKIVSVAVTFNKDMLKNNFPDVDLYQLVRDGKWTFDRMVEMSKQVTKDVTGEGEYTYKDMWGLSAAYGDAALMYLASGEKLITKDQDDYPVIAIGSERSITVAKHILEELQVKNQWVVHAQDFQKDVSDMWKTSLEIFGENRALFRTSAFSAIKKLRNYKENSDFGLVPVPKYEESQEKYYTPCSATMAYGIVIPKSARNPEFSAFMTEVMACEAKNYITGAYYESILKSRDLKDEESEEMLDKYIFSNVVYDLGVIYNFGQVSSMFNTLMTNKSTDIASTLEASKDKIASAIDSTVENYQGIQ